MASFSHHVISNPPCLSNYFELKIDLETLMHFSVLLEGKQVKVLMDSKIVIMYIGESKVGLEVFPSCVWCKKYFQCSEDCVLALSARYLPGGECPELPLCEQKMIGC